MMELLESVRRLDEWAEAGWWSLVGGMRQIESLLRTRQVTENAGLLREAEYILFNQYIEERDFESGLPTVAADVLSFFPAHYWSQDSFAAQFTRQSPQEVQADTFEDSGELRRLVLAAVVRSLESRSEHVPNRGVLRDIGRSAWHERLHMRNEALNSASGKLRSSFDPHDIARFMLQQGRGWRGLQPGDTLYRDLDVWPPFARDFGHVGMYLGFDGSFDVNDPAHHLVIDVGKRRPACQAITLEQFLAPKGTPLKFWGAYRVDLSSLELSQLIAAACAFVGTGTYTAGAGYKDAANGTFRCDGFVEHCYEQVLKTGSANRLAYRTGLFEDDTWYRLNPFVLRNCCTKKVM